MFSEEMIHAFSIAFIVILGILAAVLISTVFIEKFKIDASEDEY